MVAWAALVPALTSAGLAQAPADGSPPLVLFETPRDGDKPVVDAIRQAQKSVDVVIYELGDPAVLLALSADAQEGKTVRVLLNTHFSDSDDNKNAIAHDILEQAGAEVKYTNPVFTFTHEKAIIVDAGQPSQRALIMTLNLESTYMGKPDPYDCLPVAAIGAGDFGPAPAGAESDTEWVLLEGKPILAAGADREMAAVTKAAGLGMAYNPFSFGQSLNFALVDRNPADINEVEAIFNADWAWQDPAQADLGDLVVSPINSRDQLVAQIQQAQRSVHIFAQEFFDRDIVQAAVEAARRGVEVKALLAPNMPRNLTSAARLTQAGGQARFLAEPYEHAKATIVDGQVVYIGSINYTVTSMDYNRELGILTRQADIAAQMESEFARFWSEGTEQPPPGGG
ncbi:MAG: phospholipase D-like domain-containing protein [Opitutales bacterium]|jgi:phosphatidylserine/phosphatidylglycerophosphate/cardiolipin synthase-like enzyme